METWSLFSVTAVGLALVFVGISYFMLAGRFILPVTKQAGGMATQSVEYFRKTYGFTRALQGICARLGIHLVQSRPYAPEGSCNIRPRPERWGRS